MGGLYPTRTSTSSSKKSKKSKGKKENEEGSPDSSRRRKVSHRMSTGGLAHFMDASEKKEKKKTKQKSKDAGKDRHAMEDGSSSSQDKRVKSSRRMTTGSMDGSDKWQKEKKKTKKQK